MTLHIHGGDVYRHENYLDFSANCSPLGLPRGVREALIGAIDGVVHYPDVRCEKLVKNIAAYEGVDIEQVICGNGAADLIFAICLARKPKKALLLAPTFAEYEQALTSVGCEIVYHHLRRKEGFSLQEDFLLSLKEEQPEILFLCNPNNPTGVLTSREFIEKVLMTCEAQGTFLVVDECFLDFVKEPECYTMKGRLTSHHLFLLKAFTKRYAMAGVRLGYGLCGNGDLLMKMEEVTQPWNVSGLAQAAGTAALKERDYVEESRRLIFKEKTYLSEALVRLGFTVYDSKANYIFFHGREDLAEKLKKRQILIRDCSNYRNLQEGDYRIAVRTHTENVRLVQAFEECLKEEKLQREERA